MLEFSQMGQKELTSIGMVEQVRGADNKLGKIIDALKADPKVFVAGLFINVNEASSRGKLILSPSSPEHTVRGLNKFREYLLDGAFIDFQDEKSDADSKAYLSEGSPKSLSLPTITHIEKIGIEEHVTTTLAKIDDIFDLELMREAGHHDSSRTFYSAGSFEKSIDRYTAVIIFPNREVAYLASRLTQVRSVTELVHSETDFSKLNYLWNQVGEISHAQMRAIRAGTFPFEKLLLQLEALEQAQADQGGAKQGQGA